MRPGSKPVGSSFVRRQSNLRSLVGRVVELFRTVSNAYEIVLVAPEEPVSVDCDPTRIEQVLTNLLSNALKYSPNGGRVTVAIDAGGADVVIAVTDEGMGIAPDEREKIFERFHRAGKSSEEIPGVGLGLSLARKLVEAHGGRIEVESEVGRGSTFRVSLRRTLPSRTSSTTPQTDARQS